MKFHIKDRIWMAQRIMESANHVIGHGFAPRPDHTRDSTNCLPDWHTGVRVGV